MAEPPLEDLLSSSTIAFTGAVEATAKSTVVGVPVDERTVVVRVDRLLHGPPSMGIPAGSRVTVQLSPDLPPLAVGDSATFFANGWIYGDTLAVTEVGRAPAEESARLSGHMPGLEAPVSAVEAAAAQVSQNKLVEHAREADAIVRAHVVGLADVRSDELPREHDPNWWVATFEVDFVARGELPGGEEAGSTVRVLYANSLDVRWRECPKPKAGQGGLWLLHKTAAALADVAPFQLIHPIDRQPSIQLDVLRQQGLATAAPEGQPEEEDEEEGEGA